MGFLIAFVLFVATIFNSCFIDVDYANKMNSDVCREVIAENLDEEEAYYDGIRYIEWKDDMCWFNASILQLYYCDYYRNVLYEMNEDDLSSDCDSYSKELTLALSKIITKICKSPRCRCELSREDYESVLAYFPQDEYGKASGDICSMFCMNIDKCIGNRNNISKFKNVGVIVFSNNHYYNLYYDSGKNHLYSIGKSVKSPLFRCSVKFLKKGNKDYNLFEKSNFFKKEAFSPEAFVISDTGKLVTIQEMYSNMNF